VADSNGAAAGSRLHAANRRRSSARVSEARHRGGIQNGGRDAKPCTHTNHEYEVAVEASGSHRPRTIGTRSTKGANSVGGRSRKIE
jgi:hypothetical protein